MIYALFYIKLCSILQVSGFKGHAPLSAQRRVIETGNNRAKLRITSAVLKRNIHRQQ